MTKLEGRNGLGSDYLKKQSNRLFLIKFDLRISSKESLGIVGFYQLYRLLLKTLNESNDCSILRSIIRTGLMAFISI